MTAVFAFLGTLLLSLVVAMLAALQLADFFGATEEFILVLMIIIVFAAAATAVFAIAYAVARSVRPINGIAVALAVFAVTLVSLPTLIEAIAEGSSGPFRISTASIHIILELLIPALLIVLVQWGLVRRRWLRANGEDDLTRWPWVTTVVASLAILNPFGLAMLQAALRPAAADTLWQFKASLTAAAVAGLLVMLAIECYIRGRILRRRLSDGSPG